MPSDPLAAAVSLDTQLAELVKNERPMPLVRGNYQWDALRATASAAVMPRIYGDGGWSRYLAVHRHGGLEFALSDGAGIRGADRPPVFHLRHIVSHAWDALALQAVLLQRYEVPGPFEVVLALRDTGGSVLGHVAEGWAEPDHVMNRPTLCLDTNVLIRLEYGQLPPAEELAMVLGERIDNAWGSTGKRFLNRQGDHVGEFDLRGIPG